MVHICNASYGEPVGRDWQTSGSLGARESDNLARPKANERLYLKQKLEGTWGTTPKVNPTYAPCMCAPVPTCAVIYVNTRVQSETME